MFIVGKFNFNPNSYAQKSEQNIARELARDFKKKNVQWKNETSGENGHDTAKELLQKRYTVNYRYKVIDGTLKKLRYIRFYVIPV